MKKILNDPKMIFGLLDSASLTAAALGAYLGVTLSSAAGLAVRILTYLGLLLWVAAWIAFGMMCQRLRKGESAFTEASGKTLRIIGWCMVGLAVICIICSPNSTEGRLTGMGYDLIAGVLLPGIFLCAAMAARVLRGLLVHAMALEAEQEGVV